MNELLAIIIIVLVCCIMFFAWLLSMATCPDRMVNLINGTSSNPNQSSSSSSSVSKELILSSTSNNAATTATSNDNKNGDNIKSKKYSDAGLLQFGVSVFKQKRRWPNGNGAKKKLSVVPEQDEQLTITSRAFTKETEQEEKYCAGQQLAFSFPALPFIPAEERCVEDVINRRRQLLRQQHEDAVKAAANAAIAKLTTDGVKLATRDFEADELLLLPPPYNDYFNILRSVNEGELATVRADSMIPIIDNSSNKLRPNNKIEIVYEQTGIGGDANSNNNLELRNHNTQLKQIDLLMPEPTRISIDGIEIGTKSEPGSIVCIP